MTNERIKKILQYIKYDYRLTFWLYLNKWRSFTAFFRRRFNSIRQATFIFTGFVVGMLINYFGGTNFTQDILSNYFVMLGVMTGGAVAIIFTISIFLLQNASDLYSSQYFEVYTHDWKEKFVYFTVILIALVLLGSGLFIGGLDVISQKIVSLIIPISLILVGLVFSLIDWQYQIIRQKINPSNAIAFLESEGLRFLKRIQYDASQIAGILRAKDANVTEEMALAAAYNRILQPFIANLDRQLENLIEIAIKLGDKQEVGTTKRGFTAVYNIVSQFFEARKTSSPILPSGTVFLAVESDSQSFLYRNCERLNKAGEKFIKEGKDELATYIIDVYRALIKKAQEIQFVSQRNKNPILDLLVSNLNFFIDSGKRVNNIEVVYQGLQVLGDTAIIASEKGLSLTLHGLIRKVMEIAIYGLSQKQLIIVDQCSMTFLRIIGAVFSSPNIDRRIHFDNALKNIATISNHINTFITTGLLPNDIAARFSLSKGYDEFYQVLNVIMNQYSRLTEIRKKDRYRGDLVEFFREINMSLRTLSEQVKSCDTVLTDSIGRLLFNINKLIIGLIKDDDFKDEKCELETCLAWNIHLPYWFTHHAEKFDGGSNRFNTLTDSIAKTGILVIEQLKDKKLAPDCINCLYSITKQYLEKTTSHYGFDEPRVLEKACYLGILALKNSWDDIAIELALKIYEFESNYFVKYLTDIPAGVDPMNHNVIGLPHHDQLVRELRRWRDTFEQERRSSILRIRDDAEAMMYGIIEQIDIDRFIFEVWGVFLADSEFGKELELKWAQQKLIYTLKKVGELKNGGGVSEISDQSQ